MQASLEKCKSSKAFVNYQELKTRTRLVSDKFIYAGHIGTHKKKLHPFKHVPGQWGDTKEQLL